MMERSRTLHAGATRHSASAGLIIRQREPANLEMPFDQVDSYLTPTELFYIRSHFPAPKIDPACYRLTIDGAVRTPLAVSYEELRGMRSETRTAILECAGNSRVFLVPRDAMGNVQPGEHDWNYGGYVINHRLPIEVLVADPTRAAP
jgi:DMSO/TMAO reductase YedYZ molybdopterin-dependent catalytic subunit